MTKWVLEDLKERFPIWASDDTMRHFGTQIHHHEYGMGFELIITSEQDQHYRLPAWDGERRFTLRRYASRMESVSEFGEFSTLEEAKDALREYRAEFG